MSPEHDGPASETESIEVRIDGKKLEVAYQAGETLLHAARRSGAKAPSACEAGNCGTCMAFVVEGEVEMRANNALDPEEVEEGWVLTCQALPQSRRVVVDYDY